MRRNIFKLIKLDNKPSFKLSKENNVFDLLKFCQFQENSEENEFTRAFPTYGIEFYIDKADITFELNISDILRLVKESSKQIHRVVSGSLGNEIRFNNELISGSMLCYKDKIVHFSVFLKEQEAKPVYEYEVA